MRARRFAGRGAGQSAAERAVPAAENSCGDRHGHLVTPTWAKARPKGSADVLVLQEFFEMRAAA
jgi:hypothetical protein